MKLKRTRFIISHKTCLLFNITPLLDFCLIALPSVKDFTVVASQEIKIQWQTFSLFFFHNSFRKNILL